MLEAKTDSRGQQWGLGGTPGASSNKFSIADVNASVQHLRSGLGSAAAAATAAVNINVVRLSASGQSAVRAGAANKVLGGARVGQLLPRRRRRLAW